MSELFPELSKHADRLCVVRSMHTEGSAHGEALLRLHTGQANLVRPSVGAWVSYGLGSRKCKSAGIHHDLAPAWSWRCSKLRFRVSARGSSGNRHWFSRDTDFASRRFEFEQSSTSRHSQRQQLDLIQTLNRRTS